MPGPISRTFLGLSIEDKCFRIVSYSLQQHTFWSFSQKTRDLSSVFSLQWGDIKLIALIISSVRGGALNMIFLLAVPTIGQEVVKFNSRFIIKFFSFDICILTLDNKKAAFSAAYPLLRIQFNSFQSLLSVIIQPRSHHFKSFVELPILRNSWTKRPEEVIMRSVMEIVYL